MVYGKAKQKVRRVYSRGKSIFGGDFFKNPYMVGIAAGFTKNANRKKNNRYREHQKQTFEDGRHKSSDFVWYRYIIEKSLINSDRSLRNR